jgi:hypothetical protein
MESTTEPSYMSLGVLATASVLLEPSRPPLDMHNNVIKVQVPIEDPKEVAIQKMIDLVRREKELAAKEDSNCLNDVLETEDHMKIAIADRKQVCALLAWA